MRFFRRTNNKRNTNLINDERISNFMHWRVYAVGFVIIALILFFVSKFTGVLEGTSIDSLLNKKNNDDSVINEDNIVVRECNIVETVCPGTKHCRGANGQATGANAITSEGNKCCQFGCEGDILDVRACHDYEHLCGVGQACKMQDKIMMPEAVTGAGRSCCRFECDNEGELPVRAPFSSETICPPGSYCLDYQGKATAPKAKMSNGNSICPYAGNSNNPCLGT